MVALAVTLSLIALVLSVINYCDKPKDAFYEETMNEYNRREQVLNEYFYGDN